MRESKSICWTNLTTRGKTTCFLTMLLGGPIVCPIQARDFRDTLDDCS